MSTGKDPTPTANDLVRLLAAVPWDAKVRFVNKSAFSDMHIDRVISAEGVVLIYLAEGEPHGEDKDQTT